MDEIDFGEPIGEFGWLSNEYVYGKNYQLIEPDASLDFVYSADYTSLLRFVGEEIPGCFFSKFPAIWCVSADGAIQDVNHFLRFLKLVSSLENLCLDRPQLGQEFYDQLPAAFPRLTEFELRGDGELQLNFDFITKFSRLSSFRIWQEEIYPLNR